MEISLIEIRHLSQSLFVNNCYRAMGACNEAVSSKFPKDSVDVDRTHPGRLSQQSLSDWEAKGTIVRRIYRSEPCIYLENEMRHAADPVPLSDIANPFAEDRRVLRVRAP